MLLAVCFGGGVTLSSIEVLNPPLVSEGGAEGPRAGGGPLAGGPLAGGGAPLAGGGPRPGGGGPLPGGGPLGAPVGGGGAPEGALGGGGPIFCRGRSKRRNKRLRKA